MTTSNKRNRIFLESFLTTALVFIVMGLLSLLPFHLHPFDPAHEATKDFEFTDVYYSRLKSATLNDDIVLVNISNNSRAELAKAIALITANDPKVIAVDAFFDTPKADTVADIALSTALRSVQNKLVMPVFLNEAHKTVRESHPMFRYGAQGHVNFVGEDSSTSVIRYFRPGGKVNGKQYQAFSAAIAQKADDKAYKQLQARGIDTELINYTGGHSSYRNVELKEILVNPAGVQQLFAQKVVILGYFGQHFGEKSSLEDMYYTPLNKHITGRAHPDARGAEIHANITAMVLKGNYINTSSFFLALLVAFVICYLHVVGFVYFFVKQHMWFHAFAKVLQFLSSAILLYLTFLMFTEWGYKFNIALSIFAVLLSVDVLYLYEALAGIAYKKLKIKSFFIHEH